MTKEQIEVKIDVLLDSITHLADLLEIENNALKNHEIDKVSGLQDQKQALGNNYYGQMQYVTANPKMFLSLSGKGLDELKAAAKRLDTHMKENERLLKLGIEVNEKIMKTIIDAAQIHEQRHSVYSSKGTLGIGASSSPISCNQVF